MPNIGASVGWGSVIAASLLVGAFGAIALTLPGRVAATVTAFGGGTLIAAIGLQLVPSADGQAGLALTATGLLAGTLAYVGIDVRLTRDQEMMQTRRACQAAACSAQVAPSGDASCARFYEWCSLAFTELVTIMLNSQHDAFRLKAGTGAHWTFLADEELEAQRYFDINEYTDTTTATRASRTR